MSAAAVFRLISGVFRAKVPVDVPRLILFASSLVAVSAWAIQRSVPVPLVHLELFVLAPFLLSRLGSMFAVLVTTIETSRVVESMFGFDQIFVAAYLLLRNLFAFPRVYAAIVIGSVLAGVALLYFLYRWLPKRSIAAPVVGICAIFVGVLPLKYLEDYTKINLLGSSVGHVVGQMTFSNMFTANYRTPGDSVETYPGLAGAKVALASNSNYWLVVVESMGLPLDTNLRERMLKPFSAASVREVFDVNIGVTPSVGSTIHGELRQLCNGVLVDGLFGDKNQHCIPRLMSDHGYKAVAVHANHAAVYGRDGWYPKIGFMDMVSSDSEGMPRRIEGDRWGMLDDHSTIEWVRKNRLVGPKFFTYLLTVSTHLPATALPESMAWPGCEAEYGEQPCVHLANIEAVAKDLVAAAISLPNTVVVIVGDHPPPFANFASTSVFDRKLVPYVTLTPRGAMVRQGLPLP